MKYSLLISFFVLIIAYPTEQEGAKSPVHDEIIIDGKNHTIPDAIDVKTVVPPEPTQPTSITTPPTTNTTNSPTNSTTPMSSTTPANVTTPVPPKPVPTISTTASPVTTPSTPPSSSVPSTTATPSTTVKPPAPTTVKPEQPERRFDGPSFVGGIVLALGLVAIGFVAFKFYKARTELNYHTL